MNKIIVIAYPVLAIFIVLLLLYGNIGDFYYYIVILLSVIMLIILYESYRENTSREKRKIERIKQIELKINDAPDSSKYVWEIATIKLESYFDKNISQINSIYWISVSVILIGVGVILFSITKTGSNIELTLISSGVGVLTQFLGATLMFLYRSTIKQSVNLINILERINTVGMSIHIVETLPDKNEELKNKTKAEIAIKLFDMKTENQKIDL
jgi:hypothetical protein